MFANVFNNSRATAYVNIMVYHSIDSVYLKKTNRSSTDDEDDEDEEVPLTAV